MPKKNGVSAVPRGRSMVWLIVTLEMGMKAFGSVVVLATAVLAAGCAGSEEALMATEAAASAPQTEAAWLAPATAYMAGTLPNVPTGSFEGRTAGNHPDHISVKLMNESLFGAHKALEVVSVDYTTRAVTYVFDFQTGDVCTWKKVPWQAAPGAPECLVPADEATNMAAYKGLVAAMAERVGILADGRPGADYHQDPMPALAPFRDYLQSVVDRVAAP